MKTNTIQVISLEASDGMILRKKDNHTIISNKVFLGQNDSTDNWEEVDEETAIKEKEEIERKEQEELEKELEDRNNKYFE